MNPTNHKLVNTTPKPKATKKRRGELVGPPPPPLLELVVGPGGADDVAEAMADVGELVGLAATVSLTGFTQSTARGVPRFRGSKATAARAV